MPIYSDCFAVLSKKPEEEKGRRSYSFYTVMNFDEEVNKAPLVRIVIDSYPSIIEEMSLTPATISSHGNISYESTDDMCWIDSQSDKSSSESSSYPIAVAPTDDTIQNVINNSNFTTNSSVNSNRVSKDNNDYEMIDVIDSKTNDVKSGNNEDADDNDDDPSNHEIDRWGFFKGDEFHRAKDVSKEIILFRENKEKEREQKWIRMMNKPGGFGYLRKYREAKLKRRVKKGIPDTLRSKAWYGLCDIDNTIKKKIPDLDKLDIKSLPSRTVDEIERDIDRTFPRHELFSVKNGQGQMSLRKILLRYAAVDPEVGYCQGMGFIAGLLLYYLPEDEAFYVFYCALQKPETNLRLLYFPDMIEAQKKLFVFGKLGQLHLGKVWDHLVNQQIHPTMYATEWIMCMFCRGFSFDLVTRVWDIFLFSGYKIVYRVALALIKNAEKDFLSAKFEDIMGILRNIPALVDADELINLSMTIKLTRAQIEKYENEYDKEFLVHDI